jgi:hypothetical protein
MTFDSFKQKTKKIITSPLFWGIIGIIVLIVIIVVISQTTGSKPPIQCSDDKQKVNCDGTDICVQKCLDGKKWDCKSSSCICSSQICDKDKLCCENDCHQGYCCDVNKVCMPDGIYQCCEGAKTCVKDGKTEKCAIVCGTLNCEKGTECVSSLNVTQKLKDVFLKQFGDGGNQSATCKVTQNKDNTWNCYTCVKQSTCTFKNGSIEPTYSNEGGNTCTDIFSVGDDNKIDYCTGILPSDSINCWQAYKDNNVCAKDKCVLRSPMDSKTDSDQLETDIKNIKQNADGSTYNGNYCGNINSTSWGNITTYQPDNSTGCDIGHCFNHVTDATGVELITSTDGVCKVYRTCTDDAGGGYSGFDPICSTTTSENKICKNIKENTPYECRNGEVRTPLQSSCPSPPPDNCIDMKSGDICGWCYPIVKSETSKYKSPTECDKTPSNVFINVPVTCPTIDDSRFMVDPTKNGKKHTPTYLTLLDDGKFIWQNLNMTFAVQRAPVSYNQVVTNVINSSSLDLYVSYGYQGVRLKPYADYNHLNEDSMDIDSANNPKKDININLFNSKDEKGVINLDYGQSVGRAGGGYGLAAFDAITSSDGTVFGENVTFGSGDILVGSKNLSYVYHYLYRLNNKKWYYEIIVVLFDSFRKCVLTDEC